jgi:hypothetical protein
MIDIPFYAVASVNINTRRDHAELGEACTRFYFWEIQWLCFQQNAVAIVAKLGIRAATQTVQIDTYIQCIK